MDKEYHFLLLSQSDLLQNEVIEEIFRERTNSYLAQNKPNDFWILISPQFLDDFYFKEKLKKTNFYKQKQNDILDIENNSEIEFYAVVLSLNKEFITWLTLRLGYFENLETFENDQIINKNYISNGITGFFSNFVINTPNFLHPSILIKKYKKLLQLFYNSNYINCR
jgi:hypothetical protein